VLVVKRYNTLEVSYDYENALYKLTFGVWHLTL